MAEGARDKRNNAADEERKDLAAPEISEEYLGDISARLFDLQAERARLEGTDATTKELKAVEKEIAALQAFVNEHEEDFARMEMRAEKAREAEVIPLIKKKTKALPTAEAPRNLSADIQYLQKHYDLTVEQLTSETDPKAHAALESSIDNLRERIHTLKGDIPWEKEDRVLAKGGIKHSSAAREKARTDAPESFKAAEIDRAGLIDLRNTYSQSLEPGSLPKGGEILLRGAVQTLDDALAKYGRGDMSADAFQSRVSEIAKARKMWDRYVDDAAVEDKRAREKKEAMERAAEEAARTEETAKARKAEQNEEIKRRLKEVGKKQDAEKALRETKKQLAEADATVEENVSTEIALSEAARKRAEVRARIAEKMSNIKEQTRARRGADLNKAMADIRNLPPPLTAEKIAEDHRKADDLVDAMEAGPDLAPPPENLPVESVAETDEQFRARFRADAGVQADALVKKSIERTNAKIDVLKEKIHAEQERLRIERNELKPGVEERFFAQGENTEELAKREQATENFPNLTPDEAVTEQEKIEAKSARDFENEADFRAAFMDALAHDPLHQLSLGSADAYAKRYWQLLMKDNARLAEAMKPQPKVGFFKRLFGGGPKPKETMTAQEIVYFQKMDKFVRDIMETPATSARAFARRAARESGPSSFWTSGRTGRPGR